MRSKCSAEHLGELLLDLLGHALELWALAWKLCCVCGPLESSPRRVCAPVYDQNGLRYAPLGPAEPGLLLRKRRLPAPPVVTPGSGGLGLIASRALRRAPPGSGFH
jgi:hypothetical protein